MPCAFENRQGPDDIYVELFKNYDRSKDYAIGSIECEKDKNILLSAFRAAFIKDMRSGGYIEPSFTAALKLLHTFAVSPATKLCPEDPLDERTLFSVYLLKCNKSNSYL